MDPDPNKVDDDTYRKAITGSLLVDGRDSDYAHDLLMMDHTVTELRRIASRLDDVSRERGANKAETASAIVHQASHKLQIVEDRHGTERVAFPWE